MRYISYFNRNPSKYHAKDMKMVNWLKYNRKMRNAGKLQGERAEKFAQLTARMKQVWRPNQYSDPLSGKRRYNPDGPTMFDNVQTK